jgi:hypothetical protein
LLAPSWRPASPKSRSETFFTADYQELKQEVGLGHYEGRGWRGFHHHATLCIAAYGFLIAEQATIPPSGPRSAAPFQAPVLPDNYRPRGSARAA